MSYLCKAFLKFTHAACVENTDTHEVVVYIGKDNIRRAMANYRIANLEVTTLGKVKPHKLMREDIHDIIMTAAYVNILPSNNFEKQFNLERTLIRDNMGRLVLTLSNNNLSVSLTHNNAGDVYRISVEVPNSIGEDSIAYVAKSICDKKLDEDSKLPNRMLSLYRTDYGKTTWITYGLDKDKAVNGLKGGAIINMSKNIATPGTPLSSIINSTGPELSGRILGVCIYEILHDLTSLISNSKNR